MNQQIRSDGKPLPNERLISLQMRHDGNDENDKKGLKLEKVGDNFGLRGSGLSTAFTAWGQFIIHDILKTPDEVSQSTKNQLLLYSSSFSIYSSQIFLSNFSWQVRNHF